MNKVITGLVLAVALISSGKKGFAADAEYPTVAQAAEAASAGFSAYTTNEVAAAILRTPGGAYVYSAPVVQKAHYTFELHVTVLNGYSLAGIVHSHPFVDQFSQVFSPDDIAVADSLKVPSYIRFASGALRCYTPGTTSVQKTSGAGKMFGVKTAVGDSV